MSKDIKETASNTVETIKENARQLLEKYNSRAQEVADGIPGGFAKNIAKFPWVTISVALVVVFLLGGLFKPIHR